MVMMKSKKNIAISAVTLILAILVILWSKGIFYIVDRQTSPNGKITTTVYSHDVTGLFPKDTGFSIITSGDLKGRRIFSDGGEVEGLWWSPDSNYQIISLIHDDERLLELHRYLHSSVSNLSWYINANMSSYEEFTTLMTEEQQWKTVQFEFVQWNEEVGSITVVFEFVDNNNTQQKGVLDYNFETGVISNINFES